MCTPEQLAAGREAQARVAEGLYLLTRFHPPLGVGPAAGRSWERWVAHDLLRRGTDVTQGPGSLRLFDFSSASGYRHELDGASRAWWGALITEGKAYERASPSKADVALFDRKTADLILARHQAGVLGPHWRLLVSATPVDDRVRRYCALHGILLVEPAHLPLPYLLRAAGRAGADELADSVLWDALVRLADRAILPFEGRYRPVDGEWVFSTRWWTCAELDELLYVQDTLTAQVSEALDALRPTYFAERAASILAGLGGTARAADPGRERRRRADGSSRDQLPSLLR